MARGLSKPSSAPDVLQSAGLRGGKKKGEGKPRRKSRASEMTEHEKLKQSIADHRKGAPRRKMGRLERMQRRYLPGDVTYELSSTAQRSAKAAGMGEKELKRLKQRFDQIDLDNSGEIDQGEFFDFVNDKMTEFTSGLFSAFDLDGNGLIDFDEWVMVCSAFCLYSKEEILEFTFNTFDKDSGGTIDEDEFLALAKAVADGNPLFPRNFATALKQFDSNDDGLIDRDEFRELNKKFPMILFPAFHLQDKLRRSTLGVSWWNRLLEERERKLYMGEYQKSHNGELPMEGFCTRARNQYRGLKSYAEIAASIAAEDREMEAAEAEEEERRRDPKRKKKKKAKKKGQKVAHGPAA